MRRVSFLYDSLRKRKLLGMAYSKFVGTFLFISTGVCGYSANQAKILEGIGSNNLT